ncbi:MAG: AI-2E family transporter [Lachnospiraceae bacterium]|nr:AI-2E family transporter [Lachnospiraceae bacterium]
MKTTWKRAVIWCGTVFLMLAAAIAFYFILLNGSAIIKGVNSLFQTLIPIWLGLGLAYVVDPLINYGERKLREHNIKPRLARILMVAVVLVGIAILLFLIISRMVPRLVETINSLLSDVPGIQRTINSYLDKINEWNPTVYGVVIDMIDTAVSWINTNTLTAINSITQSFLGLVYGIVDIFVSLIVLVYAQMSKDRFIGQGKKLLYAICHHRTAATWVLDVVRQANRNFTGFITGKIIDSIIVGIICFICLSILDMPYVLLISVVIGVTNIIPVFGPFIGAIPCAVLLLFVKPFDCLVFVFFILILQQIDGNIIGPKILGNSTGLSSFWVIFSILVFSHIWGLFGMIVGVPIFATLYYVIKRLVEEELARQNLPTDSMDYVTLEKIDENNTLIYQTDTAAKKKADARPLFTSIKVLGQLISRKYREYLDRKKNQP